MIKERKKKSKVKEEDNDWRQMKRHEEENKENATEDI